MFGIQEKPDTPLSLQRPIQCIIKYTRDWRLRLILSSKCEFNHKIPLSFSIYRCMLDVKLYRSLEYSSRFATSYIIKSLKSEIIVLYFI